MSDPRDEIAEVLAARCSKSGDNMSHMLCGELVHRQHYDEADALLPWLAERDRRVAGAALREAAEEACWPNLGSEPGSGHTSAYSVRRWLRDRADRTEATQ